MGNILQGSYIDVHEAARSGHIEEVRRWIDEGKPVNARDNTQKTPLHYAAQWGQEEALDFLIECGADVTACDFIEDTPLHFACYFGHANCARILIMAGADVSAKDCYGNTPSQIFDDHVVEPVLDEIRFMVREVIQSSRSLELPAASISPASRSSDCRADDSVHPTAPGLLSVRRADGDVVPVTGEAGAVARGKSPRVLSANEASASTTDSGSGCSDVDNQKDDQQSSRSTSHPYTNPPEVHRPFSSGSPKTPARNQQYQQHPQHDQEQQWKGMASKNDSVSVDGRGSLDEAESTRPPPDASPATFAKPVSHFPAPSLLRRLSLTLPWDSEQGLLQESGGGGRGVAREKSPSSTGGMSVKTVGPARGLRGETRNTGEEDETNSRPRTLSAPQMRLAFGKSTLRTTASNQFLTGRSFSTAENNGGSPALGMAKGVGLKGASLAGTLLAYATRPGGKVDMFAAAKDGQVSVLKQALTDGQKVDDVGDNGLTSLMCAARAGRLSTAKYLVSQGANLALRDDATGFSALHFAAFYCRSSVVRILVLAGADTRATDNNGKWPGSRYQIMSYLSYTAFHHRRLIALFLSGDLYDRMDDKGKNMFPMNAPLEAYDEDHKPQYVRLGSSSNFVASADHASDEDGERTPREDNGNDGRGRGNHTRRKSVESARNAYASMKSMHSGGDDHRSGDDRDEDAELGGGGGKTRRKPRKRKNTRQTKAPGAGSGVHYYLRRMSVAPIPKNVKYGRENGTNDRPGRKSSFGSPTSTGQSPDPGSGINNCLRRASIKSFMYLQGVAHQGEVGRDGGGVSEAGPGEAAVAAVAPSETTSSNNENPAAGMAQTLAAAIAAARATAAAELGPSRDDDGEEDINADIMETGQVPQLHVSNSGGGNVNGDRGRRDAERRRLSMGSQGGIQEVAKGLAANRRIEDGDARVSATHQSDDPRGGTSSSEGPVIDSGALTAPLENEGRASSQACTGLEWREPQQRKSCNNTRSNAAKVAIASSTDEECVVVSPLPHQEGISGALVRGAGDKTMKHGTATATSDWQAELEHPLTTAPASAQPPEKNDTAVGQEGRGPHTNTSTTADTHGLYADSPATALAAKGTTPALSSAEFNRLSMDTVSPAVYVPEEDITSDGIPCNVVPKLEGDGDIRTIGPGETRQPILFDSALVPEHSEPSASEGFAADRGVFIAKVVAAKGGADRVDLNATDAAPNRNEAVAQGGILRGGLGIEQGSGASLGQLGHDPALTIRGAELNATAPITTTAQGGTKEALTDTPGATGATTVITDRPSRAEKMSDMPQVEPATPGATAVSATTASTFTIAGEAEAEVVTFGFLPPPGHLVNTSDDGEQLRLDEEVGYSAPSSPEQRAAGRGIDCDKAKRTLSGGGGEDEAVAKNDEGGKRVRKHRHRRKHNRHRDREGNEQKHSPGGSRSRDGNRGGAGGNRRDEGENATSTGSRRSSPPSPAAATLAPLKRAPPPPHLFIGATDGVVEAPVSPAGLSSVNSDGTQGSEWGDGNVSRGGGLGMPE